MPRDLWPTDGVEYSRVRKEIRDAQTAMQIAQMEAEHYRLALFLARRHALNASQEAKDCRSIWWALSVIDAGLAPIECTPPKRGGGHIKRLTRRSL